ncbi:MAG: type II toxin-antitoxin system VapC family toxin [Magnetococcales bacterium]|nr:type II toxin-antitoxin system VapC family toxin [Magnetococcales bacterium]
MSYLLDTNVLSETVRTTPHEAVMNWLQQIPDDHLYISVLSLGEIRKGIEKLSPGSRRERLRLWLEHDLTAWFGVRVLPIDKAVADRWGCLLGGMDRSIPAIDSLLAATAMHHELRLVTRNVQDFVFPGLEVVNPWIWS